MNSQLYVGTVRHRRFTPVEHRFDYDIFMPLIDLDEQIFSGQFSP